MTPRIAAGVPIVNKAHGHHTTYALGILQKEISAVAPYVKKTISALLPRCGYVVLGYSGTCDDGVMRVLGDRALTRGKVIYGL